MDIHIKRIEPVSEEVLKIELLRHQVFHLKTDSKSISLSYSTFHIMHNQLIPYGLYLNNELIAGCYISCLNDSLLIDYLFVKETYQNSGLRIGRLLLTEVLKQKNELEEFFKKSITMTKLTPNNEKSKAIYEKIGYSYQDNTPFMYKKI